MAKKLLELWLVLLAVLIACCALGPAVAAPAIYKYDNLGRLSRVSHGDGSFTRFEYDTDGNRTLRITQAKPTLLTLIEPNPLIANQPFTVRWFTTGATSIGYTCTTKGSGFQGASGTLTGPTWLPNSSVSTVAIPAWVGSDSACTWTVSGPGGTVNQGDTLRTIIPATGRPTLVVTRTSPVLVAGKPLTVTWETIGAVSLNFNCNATGTGFNSSGPLSVPSGSFTCPASVLAGSASLRSAGGRRSRPTAP